MAVDLIMPKLGLTMEEGTVVRWLVTEGDQVEKGQPILEVETDKVVVEVEATVSGMMGPTLVGEGQTVPVTTRLARIYAPGEKVGEGTPAEAQASTHTDTGRGAGEQRRGEDQVREVPISEEAEDVRPVLATHQVRSPVFQKDLASGRRVFSSPRARKRARELGVDWRGLSGSGPRGRVVEKDVLRAKRAGPTPSPTLPLERGERDTLALPLTEEKRGVIWETPTTVQRVTAERMIASFGSAPHFYLSAEVRADALLDLRTRLLPLVEEQVGVRLTITDLLVRILATVLAEHPRANAFWDGGRIGLHRQVNVGVAVATDAGLVVPVLRQADGKSLSQIALERARLVEKARAGTLSVDDLSGGTFTLTNLGMFRVDTFQAILNPPQSAILAVGRIAERPVVVEGQLVPRPTAVLSLSCDHRVLDGALAAQFLGRVVELIEEPYALLA